MVPAEAVGAGAGMVSEYANTDLMGAYAGLGEDLSLGLEGLRIGDIVALQDADHRYGRGYRPGYLTIGVISTGQCMPRRRCRRGGCRRRHRRLRPARLGQVFLRRSIPGIIGSERA